MTQPSLNLITTAKDIQALAKKLSKAKEIAFDTEFIRESTFYPKLEILQIGTIDEAWLIDMQAFQEKGKSKSDHKTQTNLKDLKPLIDVLVDPNILKVVHAAHGDQECLLSALGILATPIFDTAVGASLCGLGDHIGLGNLLKSVLDIEHPKGYARTNWSKRPLPKPVLEYAILDVQHLVQVAHSLFERLDETQRREWALDLSSKFCDKNLYEVPPEDIAKRLAQSGKFNVKDYGVLLGLVRWREERVRELNVPRRWLADDGVLIDLAKIKPTTAEQLQGFRGLSKGEHKPPHAERILKAVQAGMSGEIETPSDIKRKNILQPSSDENRGMDLLRVCLTLLSEEFQIASKHIVQPQHVLPLLRLKAKTLAELEESGLVSSQLGDKGMKALFAFLKGDQALVLDGGSVKLKKID
jgi:ribonuclease D